MKNKVLSGVTAIAIAVAVLAGTVWSNTTKVFAAEVPTMTGATIAGGNGSSLAIKTDGSLWAWGRNEFGQLGDGTTTERDTPVKIMDSVSAVAAGGAYSLAIKNDGTLWAWGENEGGELGDGTTNDSNTPIKIMDSVKAIAANADLSFAIKTDNSLWAWGGVYFTDGGTPAIFSATPVKVMDSVAAVSTSGYDETLIIKTDGSLWEQIYGEDYFNTGVLTIGGPYSMMTSDSFTKVAVGDNFSLAVKADSSLLFLGDSYSSLSSNYEDAQVLMDSVADISANRGIALAIKTDGSLWSWGQEAGNQSMLGDGVKDARTAPKEIMNSVVYAVAGYMGNGSLVLKADGSLWGWGNNSDGDLGDGTQTYQPIPIKIMDGVTLPTPIPASTTDTNTDTGTTSGQALNAVNISEISGVTAPVAGATPVTAVTETDQYTGTISWSPSASVFGYNTVYTATVTLTPKDGYTFDGVPENSFTVTGATAANVADSGVITAAFPATAMAPIVTPTPYNPPAGGSTGGGSIPTPMPTPIPTPTATLVTGGTDSIPYTVNDGTAVIATDDANSLVKAASASDDNTAVIDLSSATDVSAVTIPKATLNSIKQGKVNLTLALPEGSVSFGTTAAGNIVQAAQGSSITFAVNSVDTSALTDAQASVVGDNAVYQLSVTDANGNYITNFGGNVQVSLPYTLKDGENPNAIIIYYVSADGTLQIMPNCQYDASTGMVTFTTTHFSTYMIAHNPVTFDDIVGNWAQDVIEQAASRDLVHGYGDGTYQPNGDVTRAEFIQMVNSVLNLPAPKTNTAPYMDVTVGSWYFNAVSSAKAAGLLNGLAGSAFSPNQPITRQEMAVVLANVIYYRDVVVGDADLSNFTDLSGVSAANLTAIETAIGAGLLSADGMGGGIFDPNGVTTRGQAAEIQMNLLNVLGKLN